MGRDRYKVGPAPGPSLLQRLRQSRCIAQPPAFSPNLSDIPYRAISIFPSLLLAHVGANPNQITIFWICLGVAGVVTLPSTVHVVRVLGALLLQMSYLFDFVDGEVARLQNRSSKSGLFLDLAGHGLIKAALFLGVGYGVFVSTGRLECLVLAFVASVSISSFHNLPSYAAEAGVEGRPLLTPPQGESTTPIWHGLRRLLMPTYVIFESPGLYAAVLVGAIFDQLSTVVTFYAFTAPLFLMYRAIKYGSR